MCSSDLSPLPTPSHPSYHPIPTLQPQAPPELPRQHLGMNTHCNTIALTKLHIWQQNTRKSQTVQHYILNTDPSLYDLILLQEPWIDSYGNARGNHHWCIVYPSNRHTDEHSTIRLAILINANISTDVYATLSIPHSDITAIQLKGELSYCSIFNVYNEHPPCLSQQQPSIDPTFTHRPHALVWQFQ